MPNIQEHALFYLLDYYLTKCAWSRVVHRYKGQGNVYILLSTVADNQLKVQAKAKHEMLANLVLPAFIDEPPRARERRIERRNTFTFQAPSMRTKKDGMYRSWIAAFTSLPRYRERETPKLQGPRLRLLGLTT